MRSRRSILSLVVIIIVVVGAVYYFYSYRNRNVSADIDSVEKYTGDAATTTAVKAALALNKQVSSLDVHVETSGGNVTLTGQVRSEDEKRMVEEIVRGTKGVASLVSHLQVEPKKAN
jgi:osmotically-inducible protein OsmY